MDIVVLATGLQVLRRRFCLDDAARLETKAPRPMLVPSQGRVWCRAPTAQAPIRIKALSLPRESAARISSGLSGGGDLFSVGGGERVGALLDGVDEDLDRVGLEVAGLADLVQVLGELLGGPLEVVG